MNSSTSRIVAAVAAGTLALTGCGTPDKDAEPPAPAAKAPGAEPGAGEDAAAGPLSYDDEEYACSLVTRGDLETLFGGPVQDQSAKSIGDLRSCAWGETNRNSLLDVSIERPAGGPRRKYDEGWSLYGVNQPAGSRPAKEITGLGDKAYSYYHRGETHVKIAAGDKFVSVAVMYVLGQRTLTPEADVARVTKLAEQVLDRM